MKIQVYLCVTILLCGGSGGTTFEHPNVKIIGGSTSDSSSENLAQVVAFLACTVSGGGYSCSKLCSGTLVAPNAVLTAAHCIRASFSAFNDSSPEVPVSEMYVILGSKNYQSPDWSAGAIFMGVKRAVFGNYGTNIYFPFDSDIALLELKSCVSLVPGKIELAKIATVDSQREQGVCTDPVTVAGYGRITNAPSPLSFTDGQLRFFNGTLHSTPTCRASYVYLVSGQFAPANLSTIDKRLAYGVIDDLFICSGGVSIDSVCFGDSGGPTLHTNPNGTVEVVGVTSYGIGSSGMCFLGPGFSTRVAFYAEWLADVLQNTFGQCSGHSVEDSFSSWPVQSWPLSAEFNASRCTTSEWQCQTGECIPASQVCDGFSHCVDESDESFTAENGISLCGASQSSSYSFERLQILPGRGLNSTSSEGTQEMKATRQDCQVSIYAVSYLTTQVQQTQSVAGDVWNSVPLQNACNGFDSCYNYTASPVGYWTTYTFCKDLETFVAFNNSRNAYIEFFTSQLGGLKCLTTTTSTPTSTATTTTSTTTTTTTRTTTSTTSSSSTSSSTTSPTTTTTRRTTTTTTTSRKPSTTARATTTTVKSTIRMRSADSVKNWVPVFLFLVLTYLY